MTILFVGSTPSDLGGSTVEHTGTEGRDPDFTPVASKISYGPTGNAFSVSFDAPSGDLWAHFKIYTSAQFFSTDISDDGFWLRIWSGTTQFARVDVGNGRHYLEGGGQSQPLTIGNSTEYDVDIKCTRDGSTATATIYLGGVKAAEISYSSSIAAPDRITFDHLEMSWGEPSETGTCYYSEFVVTDGEPTIGWRVATLAPVSDGNYTAWDGDYTGITDQGDGQSISSKTAGDKQSWGLAAYNGPATTSGVRGVVNKFRASKGATGPQQITPLVRIGANDYSGTAFTPDGDQHLEVLDNDPSTSNTWDTSQFGSMEVGVEATT